MPHCESWRMVWQMQVETLHAFGSRVALYWPGARARRDALIAQERERIVQAIRMWDGSFDETLDRISEKP